MLKRTRGLLLTALMVFSAPIFAETLTNVKIVSINVRSTGTNSIVQFDKPFINQCSDNGVNGLLETDGTEGKKLAWSAVLTAATAGQSLTIVTTDECRYHNVIKDIKVNY